MALAYPACTKLLGPVVPGTSIKNGARVPGTSYELDPVQGAFNIGAIVRWLDFNDTWLAAEWGHPSDNLGAILAVSDWMSRHEASGLTPQAFQTPLPRRSSQSESGPSLTTQQPGDRLRISPLAKKLAAEHKVAPWKNGGGSGVLTQRSAPAINVCASSRS